MTITVQQSYTERTLAVHHKQHAPGHSALPEAIELVPLISVVKAMGRDEDGSINVEVSPLPSTVKCIIVLLCFENQSIAQFQIMSFIMDS